MKKFLLSTSLFLLVVVGLMFLNSCQKQDEISIPENDQEINMNFGYIPLPAEEYNAISQAKVDITFKSYPVSLSLDCPPVGDQGGEGSCVAWGTTYAGRSISYQATNGGVYSFSTNIFSPEYVYNQIKVSSDCGSGAYVTTGLNLLVDQGACTWTTMPYTDVECSTMPNTTQTAEAANYEIASYQTVRLRKN